MKWLTEITVVDAVYHVCWALVLAGLNFLFT